MKVLFLDIDGVLNFFGTDAKSPTGCDGIVDKLVKRLRTIIDNTNAFVVLTSDWKDDWDGQAETDDLPPDGQYLVKKLRRNGVHINSKTGEQFPLGYRGAAIVDWLNRHKGVESWCVLDDIVYDDFLWCAYADMKIPDHLVLTDPNVGLSDNDVAMAIDILNKQN